MRTSLTKLIVLSAILWSFFNLACPQNRRGDSDLRPVGPDVKADLLIYFKVGVTADEINAFSEGVLSRPDLQGQGDHLPEGVRTFLRIYPAVQGHEGIAITFFPGATREQRERLKLAIKSSSMVYTVLEDAVPTKVKAID